MKILFIMNPSSGRQSNERVIQHIEEVCIENQIIMKMLFTQGDHDEQLIRKELTEFRPDRVGACGGDGTLQLVAGCLLGNATPMGILPLGSANGLATALGIPKSYEEALQILIGSQRIIPLDLLRINEKYLCTHLSDIGTNALLVKSYEEAGDKGMIGYAKHLISSIQQSDLMKYQIVTPEGTFEKEGYMLAIANAHKYGTGVQISEGSVSDGLFEICNVQNIDLESAIKAGLTAINIFIDKDMFKDVISSKKAVIKIDRKAHLQIDGEYIGEVDQIDVSIISSAVQVITPEL